MIKCTILVVDDEPELLSVLGDQLSSRFENVVCKATGREVVDYVRNNRVDLVLSDYRMPEMNGLVLRNELRKLRPWLPVLILTGNDQEAELIKALPNGGFGFLEKPLRFEVLINRVRNDLVMGRFLKLAWEKLVRENPAEAERLRERTWHEMADVLHGVAASALQ